MKRGLIFFAERRHAVGSEQMKRRPWVVVSERVVNDRVAHVLAVPLSTLTEEKESKNLTTWVEIDPATVTSWSTELDGRSRVALCEQVCAMSHDRFPTDPAGELAEAEVDRIANAVANCVGAG